MIVQKGSAWQAASVSRECRSQFQRVVIAERSALWREPVKARLDHVCRLPIGWDGYQGRSVNFSSANFALSVLESICGLDTPTPSIVPGSSGDLQIEWHTDAWNLEIHIFAPYKVEAWRESVAPSIEETLFLTNDFTEVRQWVSQIGEPMFASLPTAA